MTNEYRLHLIEIVRDKEQKKAKCEEALVSEDINAKVKSWIDARTKKFKEETTEDKSHSKIPDFPDYQISESLQSITNLPPSVLPPSHDAYLQCEFSDWGL